MQCPGVVFSQDLRTGVHWNAVAMIMEKDPATTRAMVKMLTMRNFLCSKIDMYRNRKESLVKQRTSL